MIFEIFVALLLFICTISIIGILNVLLVLSDFIGSVHKKYTTDEEDK